MTKKKKISTIINGVFILFLIAISSCGDPNINTLKHEKVSFDDLPIEIKNCIQNPIDFQEERNSMLVQLPKGKKADYKVESVKTWIGPWVSYVKLIKIENNTSHKIERSTPNPFIVYENKLYVPDSYGFFTTRDDLSKLGFTRYDLK